MYQLPQRSLAIRGMSRESVVRWTKAASEAIECRRLVRERLERLSVVRVEVMEVEAEGKMTVEGSTGSCDDEPFMCRLLSYGMPNVED